jgi:hypothetical protein
MELEGKTALVFGAGSVGVDSTGSGWGNGKAVTINGVILPVDGSLICKQA